MKHSGIWFHTHYETEDEHTHTILKTLYSFVALWFAAAFFGGLANIFTQQAGQAPLPIGIFLVVPIGGFALAYAMNPRVRSAIDQSPLWEITIAHVWRFVGVGFVLGAIMRVLPPQFGYPAGLWDIAAAIWCIPLALAIRRGERSPRLRASFIAWNIFGLADLLFAVTVGILYSPSSFGVLRTDISTQLMTTFPVSLIPTFFVPLFILLHMLALRRSGELTGKSR